HGEDADAHRACDLAGERMESRIKRYKSRLRDRKRHTSNEDLFIQAQHYIVNAEDEDQGEDTPLIIAEMTSAVPTLTVGEAVMRMDLSEHPVMMFKNSKHGGLNVVFKRADGHIGWIDPSHKKD
ncbi:MAG: sigma 54 modulation/S30EA ribosomal C-terminal domain-containing protein, partial [Alphaproteobacteria bacterium]|nr:sigma 54 modulation/S30EA ribosomal C-terminal domain-containing protein [Alphaproteobacteria bacterium]